MTAVVLLPNRGNETIPIEAKFYVNDWVTEYTSCENPPISPTEHEHG